MFELKKTTVQSNPGLLGLASWKRDIVFSIATGTELKLQLLSPWATDLEANQEKKWPCIVFVQGSAWTFPDVGYELPQLGSLARKGYIVVTLTHRSSVDFHKAPAFLEDVKTGIRYLRENAELYHIDPERIGIWGTSSGGNTALLVGLTGDQAEFRTDEYARQSDSVKTVIECFGPTDMFSLFKQGIPLTEQDGSPSIFIRLFGDDPKEQKERMELMNPITKVSNQKAYPPFLIVHGDNDDLVPYEQGERMAATLCEHDVHTELIHVAGGPHEGSFWSQELLDLIWDYIERTL